MTPEDKATREQRLRRFERRTSIPLLVLSALFITLIVLPYLVQLPSGVNAASNAYCW